MPEQLHVKVGRPFVVDLRAATGTGYDWVVSSASRDLDVVVGAPHATEPRMPGAPAVTELTIVAQAVGDHELLVELRRPWEDAPVEERRFTITAE